jgi:exopolyphosphatase/guanosine-5'-triphosphate,3'-diphosphate pyrophosphatase
VRAADAHAVANDLLALNRTAGAAIAAIHPGRVDMIRRRSSRARPDHGAVGFGKVLVSEHDILDGIAWSLATDSGRSTWSAMRNSPAR